MKLTVLIFCLLVLGFAQNECQESRLFEVQTGLINLNPNDLGAAGKNKNYYQSLEKGEFEAGDFIGYAFAIAGFETSCAQTHFSLMVDVVEFQNENTRMRVVIDFRDPVGTALTVWSKVKLTYLVASATRYETLPSNTALIWATNVELNIDGAGVATAAVLNDQIFQTGEQVGCGLTFTAGAGAYAFGVQCGSTTDQDNSVAIHAYLMGFQFKPDTASNQFLAASVRFPDNSGDGTFREIATIPANSDDAGQVFNNDASFGVNMAYLTGGPNGPIVDISNFNSQLDTIKIGFVLTVINPFNALQKEKNGFTSDFEYSYSGLLAKVDPTDYNILTLIDNSNAAGHNNLYHKLPTTKYAIYGLSSFSLSDTAACTSFSVDLTINTASSYTFSADNTAALSEVYFQADIYTANNGDLCNNGAQFTDLTEVIGGPVTDPLLTARTAAGIDNLVYFLTRVSEEFATIPSNTVNQRVFQIDDNPLNVEFVVNGLVNDTTNVILTASITMKGTTAGKGYGIRNDLIAAANDAGTGVNVFHSAADGTKYSFKLEVNGNTMFDFSYTQAELQGKIGTLDQRHIGVNVLNTTAVFKYTLIIPRSSVADKIYTFQMRTDFFEFQEVYDPVTECCVSKCPTKTGLDVAVTPPVCVVCDTSRGLQYNPVTGSCACAQGFYLDANLQFQCFPCESALCSTCDPNNTNHCITCVTGATFNQLDHTCSCSAGFYQSNGSCLVCPSRCATCSSATVCTTCSQAARNINSNCSCPVGFFDSGATECQACNPSCATCANATTCLTCDARKFRVLRNGICVCESSFYELAYQNGTRSCLPCSPECANCSISSTDCTACSAAQNRIEGYDSLGHKTCICRPGFAVRNGSTTCVQSDCNADPFCSSCEKDLALCVACMPDKNRVIKLPEHVCVCKDGYYADSANVCQPCKEGCAKCSSATNCTSCVAQATTNNNGTCSCKTGLFFAITSTDVRYCDECVKYCDKCINSVACQTCATGFVLSTDNTCVCPKRNFINANGSCVPCKTGCETCTNTTNCQKCVNGLVVERDVCLTTCSQGFFLEGTTCRGCPTNCVGCTAQNQCFYCANNFFLHAGSCYSICPSGTVADKINFQCKPCNDPCRTCANHPSSCTSCEPGEGYLQITQSSQSCVKQCAEGTYPKNNVCEVCDFKCAKCLGAANNCIACPAGRFLYNGACWDFCPGVTVNNTCIDSCPMGFYRFSSQECKKCQEECESCDNNQTCLTCNNNFLSRNGTCVADCGAGFYTFRGFCVACDSSCKSCQNVPTQCIECATGFIRDGARCVSSCSDGSFLDSVSRTCQPCSSTCKTCSSANLCTSCPNPSIVPINGQCLTCIYPCQTCSADLSTCFTCLTSFSLSAGQCVRTCPTGSRSVNGVCTCASGIFFENNCVSTCPSGYTNVNGSCQRCVSPCTECGFGSTSSCTDCLEGFVLNPNTRLCVASSACNFGQEQVNGACERICEAGYFYQNGACIFGECPVGLKDNGFGGCVVSSTNTNRCEVPTFRLNGVCVENCGTTFFPNSNSRTCDACSTNCRTCLSKQFCFECATGFTSINGRCVTNSNCPSTQFSFNGTCVNTCPNGTYLQNGVCNRSCPAGSYYFSDYCYQTCPLQAPLASANVCVVTCPAGTTQIDGVCATIV